MKWDELKTHWQAYTTAIDLPGAETDIVKRVRQHANRFERRIRMRDWLETIAAVIVAIVLGFAFVLPGLGWLTRAGILLVLASCVFIVWRLHSVRTRHTHEPDCTTADLLGVEILRLDDQIRLLGSIFWWYLAPLGTGVILIVLGKAGWSWFSLLYAVAVLAIYTGIYYLNRRAVQNELQPRRQELAAMLESITSSEQLHSQENTDRQ